MSTPRRLGPFTSRLILPPPLPPPPVLRSLLEQMQAEVQAGKFTYRPPWDAPQQQQQQAQQPQPQPQADVTGSASAGAGASTRARSSDGNRTGHSGASSLGAAFLTPGVLDERRSSATPTVTVR